MIRSRRILAFSAAIALVPSTLFAETKPHTIPGRPHTPAAARQVPETVARVNGHPISREDLGRDCLRRHGEEVLESLISKRLILQLCKEKKLSVTKAEVEEYIQTLAERFRLDVDSYLAMLHKERGVDPAYYAEDIVWPRLALQKLAAEQSTVSAKELRQYYEMYFGPAVQVRLIALKDEKTAREIHATCLAAPEQFGDLAKEHSVDVNSASTRGLIQPIRRYMGDPEMERVAFALKQGEISEIIPVADQFIFMMCESHIPPKDMPLEQVEGQLAEEIKTQKLRSAADTILTHLLEQADVRTAWQKDLPEALPDGVAALVNGQQILLADLAAECVKRHGLEVLDGTISRHLLELALNARSLKVERSDIETEIVHAAEFMGMYDENGQPDTEAFVDEYLAENGVSRTVYEEEILWQSVALKKLVGDSVQVTEQDLQMAFEASFGPRVRCLAIVLNNQRKAQEVWEMARENPSEKYFGDLAAEYSIETGSRSLRGEVPPVQRHGGQKNLEEEAFRLQPGELSSIIPVGEDRFIILKCLGRTEPKAQNLEDVRELLVRDIEERKMRLEMSKEYERILEQAQIENLLAPANSTGLNRPQTNPEGRPARGASADEAAQNPPDAPAENASARGNAAQRPARSAPPAAARKPGPRRQ